MGATAIEARTLTHLGMASFGQGDLAAARRYLVEGLARARVGGRVRAVRSAQWLGGAPFHRGRAGCREDPLYEEALQVARDWKSRALVTVVLLNLTWFSFIRGSTERARQRLREAMAAIETMGSSQNAPACWRSRQRLRHSMATGHALRGSTAHRIGNWSSWGCAASPRTRLMARTDRAGTRLRRDRIRCCGSGREERSTAKVRWPRRKGGSMVLRKRMLMAYHSPRC